MPEPATAAPGAAEPPLARVIAGFAAGLRYEDLPDDVTDSVRKRVLDVLGICVAASTLPTSAAARDYAAGQGGRPAAHAVGMAGLLPAGLAAFVNGTLAHSLDFDDTHLPSVLHPSASVVPAALAAAEEHGRDGAALTVAIAAGLEACVRLGMAGYDEGRGQSAFFEHGQHATSICGTLGAAVAAGLLAGFDSDGLVNVLGLAASMGSGVIEANRTGGTVKRLHCGWAAHAALAAAALVRHGFTGPPTVLEGRFGFFQAWLHGEFFPEKITSGLGTRWEVPGIFFKPYPANHFTHTVLDAAASLRADGVKAEDIDRIRLGVPAQVMPTVGDPIDVKRSPATGYMAQFSGPYAVAVGLLGGGGLGAALEDYTDELAADPVRRAIMAKVDVVADPECTAVFPYQFPCVLHLTMADGTELTRAVMTNRGGPGRPLSYDELSLKFAANAGRLLAPDAVTAVQGLVSGLGTLATLDPLWSALAFRLDKAPAANPLPNPAN